MLDEKILKKKIIAALEPKRLSLRPYARDPRLDLQAMSDEYLTFGHRLEQFIADTATLAHRALDAGQIVVFEGAQGALLDIDHGTYPFVTSSNPVAGAACVGAGVGPRDIDEVWGIAKAYTTRVGAGPFPTELDDETGAEIRERGGEFGTTTGRPRRTRLARPRRPQVRRAHQLADRARGHQARRASAASTASRSARATAARRRRRSTPSPTTSRSCTTPSASTPSCPAGARTSARRAASTSCRRPRATTCASSPSFIGVPVVLVGVGPGRDQIIWTGDGAAALAA